MLSLKTASVTVGLLSGRHPRDPGGNIGFPMLKSLVITHCCRPYLRARVSGVHGFLGRRLLVSPYIKSINIYIRIITNKCQHIYDAADDRI